MTAQASKFASAIRDRKPLPTPTLRLGTLGTTDLELLLLEPGEGVHDAGADAVVDRVLHLLPDPRPNPTRLDGSLQEALQESRARERETRVGLGLRLVTRRDGLRGSHSATSSCKGMYPDPNP